MSFLNKENKQNSFGLRERDMVSIRNVFSDFESVEKVVIFGSRAMGNYKKGSDIDIAIFGENITYNTVLKISGILNEDLPIPYFIDIVHFDTLKNEELKNHILKEGKIIYTKQLDLFDAK